MAEYTLQKDGSPESNGLQLQIRRPRVRWRPGEIAYTEKEVGTLVIAKMSAAERVAARWAVMVGSDTAWLIDKLTEIEEKDTLTTLVSLTREGVVPVHKRDFVASDTEFARPGLISIVTNMRDAQQNALSYIQDALSYPGHDDRVHYLTEIARTTEEMRGRVVDLALSQLMADSSLSVHTLQTAWDNPVIAAKYSAR